MNLDSVEWRVRGVAMRSLGDPGVNDPILPRIDREPLTSFVRHLAGRLEQDKAPLGMDDIDSPAECAPGYGGIVASRVVAKQTQVQPPPPLKRAVACAGTTTKPAQQAGDMAIELDMFKR